MRSKVQQAQLKLQPPVPSFVIPLPRQTTNRFRIDVPIHLFRVWHIVVTPLFSKFETGAYLHRRCFLISSTPPRCFPRLHVTHGSISRPIPHPKECPPAKGSPPNCMVTAQRWVVETGTCRVAGGKRLSLHLIKRTPVHVDTLNPPRCLYRVKTSSNRQKRFNCDIGDTGATGQPTGPNSNLRNHRVSTDLIKELGTLG